MRLCARCAAVLRAPSPWSRSRETTRDVVVAARRNSPLVVGRGNGENFLASDVAAFIAHTRDAIELGQDQVVELRADSITITDFDGAPAQVREYHVDWDASAAEKGGYDYFMLKEIAEQPQAVADTLLGRVAVDGTLTPGRDAAGARGAAARSTRSSSSPAARSYHAGPDRQVRHRALEPDPVRGRAGQRVPLPRPDPGPRRRWSSPSPSRARPWTP